MRSIPAILALCSCLALACSRAEDSTTAAPAETEVAATSSEAASEAGAMPARDPSAGHDYVCDGVSFNARIEGGNALVAIDGKTVTLAPATTAAGARWEGEGLTFIARGAEATLVRDGQPPLHCTSK